MKKYIILILAASILAACSAKEAVVLPADESYRKGLALMKEGEFLEAVEMFENTIREGDNPELIAKAQLLLGDSYFAREEYDQAIPAYEMFLEIYPDNAQEADAMIKLALSYYNQLSTTDRNLGKMEKALKYFTLVNNKYPGVGSVYEPAKKASELMNMIAERELYVMRFYLRTNVPKSAEMRAEFIMQNYSSTPSAESAYFEVAEYYKKEGKPEKAKEFYDKYLIKYPGARLDTLRNN